MIRQPSDCGRWVVGQGLAVLTGRPQTVHRRQDGFKAHVAVEPDTGIITYCQVSKASGPLTSDAEVGPELLADEDGPRQVLADSADGSVQPRADLAAAGHEAIIKPGPPRPAVEVPV